jgi:hypothetical protein
MMIFALSSTKFNLFFKLTSSSSAMKALFTNIGKTPQQSLIVLKRDVPYFDTPFHFHPECELVYIVSGTGK